MKPTAKQLIALEKLAVAPARQNDAHAPVGITKHHDGTTLNGNLQHKLAEYGWIACRPTGIKLPRKYAGTSSMVEVREYTITDKGREVLACWESEPTPTALQPAPTAKPNKLQMIDRLHSQFPESDFVVNLILTRHSNPARKLSGLLTLLAAGHTVSVAQYSADRLLVNGEPRAWVELEMSDADILSKTAKVSEPQPVVAILDQAADEDAYGYLGAPSTESVAEVTSYEANMARRLGVPVSQLRKEQAEGEAWASASAELYAPDTRVMQTIYCELDEAAAVIAGLRRLRQSVPSLDWDGDNAWEAANV